MSGARPGGLGRGLGELFQRTDVDDQPGTHRSSAPMPDGSYFAEIPVDEISPNPQQPRQNFDGDELAELAESIGEVGLLQPIVVRKQDAGYQLVMGERRWRAHQLAGLKDIPAIVRVTEDANLLRDALLENLHRTQLNPLEEAAAYQQMLDDFGCTKEELASRVKKSRPHISNTLRLLGLPTGVQRRVAAGVLSAGHARAILVLTEPDAQERLAQRIVAEGMSVRAAEEAAALASDEPAGGSVPRLRSVREVPEHVQAYASGLADRLDTRVQVSLGARKGKLTIEFADADDLDRIMQVLGR
ncbi:MAG: ParB/RepB/Spo0J family partition protein [Brooklawnia sp.]|uniref:ParB/RepB/Spo0J family partition protein n=1 Tax=Brooklawnia sp. TaxID=2699740 RepID=UPI003C7555D2